MNPRIARFIRDARGLSGIEFALISPILITLMMGGFEYQRYLRIDRQLAVTTETVAELMAQEEGPLVDNMLNMNLDVAVHMFPEAGLNPKIQWWHALVHQISHVVFTPSTPDCAVGCSFSADMAWIWPNYETGSGWGPLRRKCGNVPLTGSGSTSGPGIPEVLAGHGSMIVVDLKFEYKPFFGSTFFPSVTMIRNGYAAAQFAHPYIKYPTGDRRTLCPGY